MFSTNNHGKNNVMTISWHVVMDFAPHIAISTGPWNHSFHTMLEATRIWYNEDKPEKRVCHAIGNGSFSVNGEIIDYRTLMEEKVPDGV